MILEVINTALKAGKEIIGIYEDNFSVQYKDDRTPLTEADRRSHKVIAEGLERISPNIPILSEEGKDIPYEKRKSWKRFWLVDPLDGTKEFIKRNGEFTVNIALIEDRKPTLGVVYAPALNLLYFAQKDKGAYRLKVEEDALTKEDLKEAERLPLYRNSNPEKVLRVVASRSHMNEETRNFIERLRNRTEKVETLSIGSSLKICLVAEGKADIYPRLGPTMEWDTAPAHAVALESGCEVHAYENGLSETLTYNKENLLNPHFIVFRRELAYLLDKGVRACLS